MTDETTQGPGPEPPAPRQPRPRPAQRPRRDARASSPAARRPRQAEDRARTGRKDLPERGGKPAGPNAGSRPATSAAKTPGAKAPVKGRKARRRRGCLAAIAFALAVVSGAIFGVWSFLFAPTVVAEAGQPVQIDIPKGAGSSDIAELLANSGVIANPNMFRLRLRMSESGGSLKAGVYDMSTGLDYDAVIAQLQEGPPIHYITVTIPEGFTVEQIAARVEEKTGIPSADFLQLAKHGAKQFEYPFIAAIRGESLEGYLFPKTYRVRVGSTPKDVIDLMLRQFATETSGLDMRGAASRGHDLHDVVIIASMIERETKMPADRPLVSSVIYNRLAKGMLLEIDATVQYVVGNKPRLLYKDLRVDSPYNTYRNRGLPPGPIACPGLASLEAAAAPAQTSYLYYVLTGKDGTHSFASTNAEFLKLKAEAKKGLK